VEDVVSELFIILLNSSLVPLYKMFFKFPQLYNVSTYISYIPSSALSGNLHCFKEKFGGNKRVDKLGVSNTQLFISVTDIGKYISVKSVDSK
jgi:hypothetical protein